MASFRTLLTRVSSSFLLGFFSIFRYRLICQRSEVEGQPGRQVSRRRGAGVNTSGGGPHLLRQQDGGIAVLLAGLGAQRDEAEQEEGQAGAPHQQLPVVVALQEGLVDVQQLQGHGCEVGA